jgi:hypothetical protein
VVRRNFLGLDKALFWIISSANEKQEPDFKEYMIESAPSDVALYLKYLNRSATGSPKKGLTYAKALHSQTLNKAEILATYGKSLTEMIIRYTRGGL